jgi:CheY-like chemotaxis protein
VSSLGEGVRRARILVIEDEDDIAIILRMTLEREGFEVFRARTGEEGLATAEREGFDLILLDLMLPRMDGIEVCRRLRARPETSFTPVIVLSARSGEDNIVEGLRAGANDYVTKPFGMQELVTRIRVLKERTETCLDTNPTTRLPGSSAIAREVARRLRDRSEEFAVCYADIDNFKSYNDAYGFGRGDEAIRMVGDLLRSTVEEVAREDGFIGHIGGDDFVIIVPQGQAELLGNRIRERFKEVMHPLYAEGDRRRGYVEAIDRQGRLAEFPLMTISLAIVANEGHRLVHYSQFVERLTELKCYAKSLGGDRVVRDRRVHAPPEAEGARPEPQASGANGFPSEPGILTPRQGRPEVNAS